MSYENPQMQSYSFGAHDFGAGGDSFSIRGPAGKKGRLVHVSVSATETFTDTTTPGYVRIGTAADNDAYAELNLGTTADTDCVSEATDTDAIIDEAIPADSQVEVTLVAPTGGTPAGIGHVHIGVEWY